MTAEPGTGARRPLASRCLVVLGVLALMGGLLAGVANREVLDGDRFAAHVDGVRRDPDVARLLGQEITARLLAAEPDLVALRPLIEVAAATVVASPAFSGLLRTATAPLHRAVVSDENDQVVLRLADVAALVLAALRTFAPDVTLRAPPDLELRLAALGSQDASGRLIDLGHRGRLASWLLPLLGLALLVGAALLRRRSRWPADVGRTVGA